MKTATHSEAQIHEGKAKPPVSLAEDDATITARVRADVQKTAAVSSSSIGHHSSKLLGAALRT